MTCEVKGVLRQSKMYFRPLNYWEIYSQLDAFSLDANPKTYELCNQICLLVLLVAAFWMCWGFLTELNQPHSYLNIHL